MNSISINYALLYQIAFAPEYQWSKCGKCFNTKTGRKIKQVYNSRCLGYNIRGKFYSLKKLRTQLELIKTIKTPF